MPHDLVQSEPRMLIVERFRAKGIEFPPVAVPRQRERR
jgi:hypothetical protein